MRKFDHSDLDGHLLQLLIAILETGSITRAAQRLGVTQSAVSHLLNKLRTITGDALFVKSGRGIVATARAEALVLEARKLLTSMEHFVQSEQFDPAYWKTSFTIAANDFQRDVLLPPLITRLQSDAPGVTLRIIPSGVPTLDMLRLEQCQMIISPRPPDGTDIMQKRLFEDTYRVFYDAVQRTAPVSPEEYLAAEHVTVMYEPQRMLDLDQWMTARGVQRHFRVLVPGFAGLPSFITGSTMLATAPGLLRLHLMRGLASTEVPLPCPGMPMYMIWHMRHQNNPAHRWLREQLLALVPAVLT